MDRLSYILRRLLLSVPTFIGITLVCFALTRFLPGGPVEMKLMRMRGAGASGESGAVSAVARQVSDGYRRELEAQFGFDKPIVVQYYNWLVKNKMGLALSSYDYPNRTAWELIRSRLPVSLTFGIAAFLLTYLICVPLGIAKALYQTRMFDAFSSLVVFAAYAVPSFALAMLLKTLFCGTVEGCWDIFPLGGVSGDFDSEPSLWEFLSDRIRHMVLPVACYVAGSFAMLTLLMKNSLLDQISSDYVRTVIAKGATRARAVWCHAFRNSLIPLATGLGPMISLVFAGSIIIETIFEIPGMGRLSWDALVGRDYAVFLALLALTSVFQLVGNLISDILYMFIDPRIDFARK
ncbi:MAG: ABC transporter permease subunit [Kiritimatiellae bacterium]|nr:ABC transporter permease subunit [Kiritimatiellia bacterium]